jgi:hypothetical protein
MGVRASLNAGHFIDAPQRTRIGHEPERDNGSLSRHRKRIRNGYSGLVHALECGSTLTLLVGYTKILHENHSVQNLTRAGGLR